MAEIDGRVREHMAETLSPDVVGTGVEIDIDSPITLDSTSSAASDLRYEFAGRGASAVRDRGCSVNKVNDRLRFRQFFGPAVRTCVGMRTKWQRWSQRPVREEVPFSAGSGPHGAPGGQFHEGYLAMGDETLIGPNVVSHRGN